MYEKLLCSIPNTGKSQMRNSLPGILSVCSGLSPRVEEQCCAALCTLCLQSTKFIKYVTSSPIENAINPWNTTNVTDVGPVSAEAGNQTTVQNPVTTFDDNKRMDFNSTDVILKNNATFQLAVNETQIDYLNETVFDCSDVSEANGTCTTQLQNDTLKSNYTLVTEEAGNISEYPMVKVFDSAVIAAGICLVSAVIGYFGCVGYRHYLQWKYGSSRIVTPEDVYDTTDLKYFEI
ncbi:hypothetical protein RUM44_004036 [Polyplax serrata]|uniref:Uncharacterized protein n=1 Tax=Polyplax serrata TaxID=468196 RepID=A0ABR1B233_POLSC